MKSNFDAAIANFGAEAKEKLANVAATGQPEDQLRAPFERLLAEMAQLSNLSKAVVAAGQLGCLALFLRRVSGSLR
jgi:hypothetical protein